jgi:drug/metabolite transporter (DMT)-like permease
MNATSSRDVPLKGIFYMCLAVALIAIQEAMAKFLAETLPVLQVIGARYFGHLLLMVVILMPRHGFSVIKAKRPLVQLGRSVLLLIDTGLFFFSLTMIGLAEATAIFFSVPILVVLLSMPLLGERVVWARLLAVAIGFIGMLVIIRPGTDAIGIGAWLTFGAAICASLFNIITRKLADEDPLAVTMFYTALAGAALMIVIVPFIWVEPQGWQQWAAIVLIGIFGGAAHSFIIASHLFAPASTVAPYMYSQIFWSIGFGFIFFAALPDEFTVLGSLIVIASGIYLLRREKTNTELAV